MAILLFTKIKVELNLGDTNWSSLVSKYIMHFTLTYMSLMLCYCRLDVSKDIQFIKYFTAMISKCLR